MRKEVQFLLALQCRAGALVHGCVAVNCTCQLGWIVILPFSWLNIVLECVCEGCFWKMPPFELVNKIKQMALPCVGGSQPSLNRTKDQNSVNGFAESLPDSLSRNMSSPSLSVTVSGTRRCSTGSPTSGLQATLDFRLCLCLYVCLSVFLCLSHLFSLSIHILLVLTLWRAMNSTQWLSSVRWLRGSFFLWLSSSLLHTQHNDVGCGETAWRRHIFPPECPRLKLVLTTLLFLDR